MAKRIVGNFAAAMLAASLLAACGDATQAISVVTLPQGGNCEFSRDGKVVASVNPTPGVARVERINKPLDMNCSKPGHDSASEKLVPSSNGSNVAAFIFGGLIGLAANAARGNDNQFPESVTVILNPQSFPSIAERESFYEEMKALARKQAKEQTDREKTNCTVSQELCNQSIKKINDTLDRQLEALEKRRQSTPVAGYDTPPPAPAVAPQPPEDPAQRLANKNPVSFANVSERDAWVDYQRAQAGRTRDAELQIIRIECNKRVVSSGTESACGKEIDDVLTKYNAEAARIEKLRSSIPVRASI